MFPTWLSSFEETIINDDTYVNVYSPISDYYSCVPKTPDVLVFTNSVLLSNAEVNKASTETEMCTCSICTEPSFIVLSISCNTSEVTPA